MLTFENEHKIIQDKNNKYNRVVGIDEVGRGPLAGPVAVGAYVVDLKTPHIENIKDSKKLSLKKREIAHTALKHHEYKIVYGGPKKIDKFGIARVIEALISHHIKNFDDGKTFFLIDGQFKKDFGKNSMKVKKGDSLYYSIAAAAILAKVERDNYMKKMAEKYSNYGWERNKGYGTKEHRDAIKEFGISEEHRVSFC